MADIGSPVELMISCRKLKNMDMMSKSDPRVVVFLRTSNTQQWSRIGVTEIVRDNLNPDFSTVIPIFY